jgi:hypothetical protein
MAPHDPTRAEAAPRPENKVLQALDALFKAQIFCPGLFLSVFFYQAFQQLQPFFLTQPFQDFIDLHQQSPPALGEYIDIFIYIDQLSSFIYHFRLVVKRKKKLVRHAVQSGLRLEVSALHAEAFGEPLDRHSRALPARHFHQILLHAVGLEAPGSGEQAGYGRLVSDQGAHLRG